MTAVVKNAADRSAGVSLLGRYYDFSSLQLIGKTKADLVAYYDSVSPGSASAPGFVEQLGAGFTRNSDLNFDEYSEVLQRIAGQNPGQIPDYRDFIPAIIDEINGTAHTLRVVKAAVVETAKQVEAAVIIGGGGYLLALAVIAGIMILGQVRARA